MKIQELVKSLTTFDKSAGKSRQELLEELTDNIVTYFEYNRELAEYFVNMFPPAELLQLLEANENPRPLTIRTNTLKTKRRELAQALMQKGVNLDPVGDWTKVGLKIIDSQVPIGATTEYLAGHYMLQSASSFLPVMALAPKPKEKILDMCAAPGGKTTHIAQLMKNSGLIVANELNKDRLPGLRGNVHRMGVTNTIICNYDARRIHHYIADFDRVLLDAPCSGLGVISKDPAVKANRNLKDIQKNAHLQKELILAAIDAVDSRSATGGYIVYSTCSISLEENEEVVEYALHNRNVKIVDTGLTIGEPGFPKFRGKSFHAHMNRCRRIYPHTYNMEGFFVAKLKKISNAIPDGASKPHSAVKRLKQKKLRQLEKQKEAELNAEQEQEQQDGEEVVAEMEKVGKKRARNEKKDTEQVSEETNGDKPKRIKKAKKAKEGKDKAKQKQPQEDVEVQVQNKKTKKSKEASEEKPKKKQSKKPKESEKPQDSDKPRKNLKKSKET